MKDQIFLIVKMVVETKHRHINCAIQEIEEATVIDIPSTPNVRVLECKLLKTHRKNVKKG